ncbi:hypothetical protein FOZ63_016642, partial [Perkinsus olseni]
FCIILMFGFLGNPFARENEQSEQRSRVGGVPYWMVDAQEIMRMFDAERESSRRQEGLFNVRQCQRLGRHHEEPGTEVKPRQDLGIPSFAADECRDDIEGRTALYERLCSISQEDSSELSRLSSLLANA